MQAILRRLRIMLIATLALAFSASLTFGAQAPGRAFVAAGPAAGGTVISLLEEDEEGDETAENAEEDGDGGENCLTDPRTLTEEELAAMSHGSIVCWAAHQETPEGYRNHGAWVSEWARMGHGADAVEAAKAKGKGKGLSNRP